MAERAARKSGRKTTSRLPAVTSTSAQGPRKVHAVDIIFGAQPGALGPRRRGVAPDPNASEFSGRPIQPPAVRRRPQPGPRTPAAVAGRQHAGQQIDAALERLTSAELAACGVTQTDESGSLPPPTPPQRQRRQTAGRSGAAAAVSCDAGTQLTDTELPSFDAEVEPVLDVVVEHALQEGMLAAARRLERHASNVAVLATSSSLASLSRTSQAYAPPSRPARVVPTPATVQQPAGLLARSRIDTDMADGKAASALAQVPPAAAAAAAAAAPATAGPEARPHYMLPAASERQQQQPVDANYVGSPQQSVGSSKPLAWRRSSVNQAAAGGTQLAARQMLAATDDAADQLVTVALQAAGAAPDADAGSAAGLGAGAAALRAPTPNDAADGASVIARAGADAMAVPTDLAHTSTSATGTHLLVDSAVANAVAGAAPHGLQPAVAQLSKWQQEASSPEAHLSGSLPPRPAAGVSDVDGELTSIDGQPAVDARLRPADADAAWSAQRSTHLAEPEAAGRRHTATLAPSAPSAIDTKDTAGTWQSAANTPPAQPSRLLTRVSAAAAELGYSRSTAPTDEDSAMGNLGQRLPGEPPAAWLTSWADGDGRQPDDQLASAPSGEVAASSDRRRSHKAAQQPVACPSGDAAATPDCRHTGQAATHPSPAASAQPGPTPDLQQLPDADDGAGLRGPQLETLQQQASPAAAAVLSDAAVAEPAIVSAAALQQTEDLAAASARTDWSSHDAVSVVRAPSTRGSSVCSSSDGSVRSIGDSPDASDCGAVKLPSLEWLLLDAASCGEAAAVPPAPQADVGSPLPATAQTAAGMPPAAEPAATEALEPSQESKDIHSSAAVSGSAEIRVDMQPDARQASPEDSHASAAAAQALLAAQTALPAAAAALPAKPALPPVAQAALPAEPAGMPGAALPAAAEAGPASARPLLQSQPGSALELEPPDHRSLSSGPPFPGAGDLHPADSSIAEEPAELQRISSPPAGTLPPHPNSSSTAQCSREGGDLAESLPVQQPGSEFSAPPWLDADHLMAEPYSAGTTVVSDATVPSDAKALQRLSRSSLQASPAATAEQQDLQVAAGVTLAAMSATQLSSRREGVAAADVDDQSEDGEQDAAADDGIHGTDVWARSGGSQSADGSQSEDGTASLVEDSIQLQAEPAFGDTDVTGSSPAPDADASLYHDAVAATSAEADGADSRGADHGGETSGGSAAGVTPGGAAGMAALAAFVAPEFVTPRHSDEGGTEPHNILPRYLLFSPGMDTPAQEPPHEPADTADVQETEIYDAGHILPAACTANFGVSAVAAIPEPKALTVTDTARRHIARAAEAPLLTTDPADMTTADSAGRRPASIAAVSAAADSSAAAADPERVSASDEPGRRLATDQTQAPTPGFGSLAQEASGTAVADVHDPAVTAADAGSASGQQTVEAAATPITSAVAAQCTAPSDQHMQRSAVSSWARNSSHATGRRNSAAAAAAAALEAEDPGSTAAAAAAAIRAAAQSPQGPAPLRSAAPAAVEIQSQAALALGSPPLATAAPPAAATASPAAAAAAAAAAAETAGHMVALPLQHEPRTPDLAPTAAASAQAAPQTPQAAGLLAASKPASAPATAAAEADGLQPAASSDAAAYADDAAAASATRVLAAQAEVAGAAQRLTTSVSAAPDATMQHVQHQHQHTAAAELHTAQLTVPPVLTALATAAATAQHSQQHTPAAQSHSEQPAAFVHMPVHHASHHRLAALPTIYESEDALADGGNEGGAVPEEEEAGDEDESAGDGAEGERPFNWPIVWPAPGTF